VVVGAGSGGAPLAARLSENPSWSVLLLEAGDDESPLTDVPAMVSYFVSTDYNWGYKAEKDPRYTKFHDDINFGSEYLIWSSNNGTLLSIIIVNNYHI